MPRFRMFALSFALAVLLFPTASRCGETDSDRFALPDGKQIVHVDFAKGVEVNIDRHAKNSSKGHITGRLPEVWGPWNSANWANRVTMEVKPDDGMTQRDYLHVAMKKMEPHNRLLLRLDWKGDETKSGEPALWRFTFRLRGTPGLPVNLNFSGMKGRPRMNGQWMRIEHVMRVDPNRTFRGYMEVYGGAHDEAYLDLTTMTVEQIGIADIKAAIDKAYGTTGYPKNLLRVTRFPLGKPMGWTVLTKKIASLYADIGADPEETSGPSGLPALRITSTGDNLDDMKSAFSSGKESGIPLISAPFECPASTDKHVLSIYAKGEGSIKVEVRNRWKRVGSIEEPLSLTPEKDWVRIEVPFDPLLYTQSGHAAWLLCDIKKGKSIWIDAMQVERGEKATEYGTRFPAEIMLSMPQATHVQFADETAEVRYAVSGDITGATLHARLTDPFGKTVTVEPVTLEADGLQTGTIDYNRFPNRPYNQVRVEAWVEKDGKRISNFDEIIATRIRRPRYWGKDAPDSPFAGHFDWHPQIAETAKAIGMNWVRDWTSQWQHLEPKQGEWLDRKDRLQVYRDAKIRVLAVASGVPGWARAQFEGLKPTDYPAKLEDYQAYIRKFIEFNKGNVHAIEIFNEPWISRHFNKGEPLRKGHYVEWDNPHAKFDELTRAGREATRAADPSVQVIGINTSTGNPDWGKGMMTVNGLDHCDAASFHCYMFGKGVPGDSFDGTLAQCLDPLRTETAPRIWMTEGSPNAHLLGAGLLKYTLPNNETDPEMLRRGDRLVRYGLAMLANGVERIFYYQMGGAKFYESGDWGWAVLLDGYGYPLPEAVALSTFAWHVENTNFVRTIPLGDGTYAYLFEAKDKNRSVAVLVSDPSIDARSEATRPIPAGMKAEDIFGNPLAEIRGGPYISYVLHSGPIGELEQAF